MSERDEHDERAEKIVARDTDDWNFDLEGRVAAALRANAKREAELREELAQAREAIAHLTAGKPLGEIVEAHTIRNMAEEIGRLTQFVNEVTVWVQGGGHTLGCECGAAWCARRKEVLEAK